MIPALARFVDALRAEGVAVSPPEAVDAARALEIVGLEHRETVRRALSAVLAKDRGARATFQRLFDAFFAPPRIPREGKGRRRPAGVGKGTVRFSEAENSKRRTPKDPIEKKKGTVSHRKPGKVIRAERRREVAPSPRHRPLARRMTMEEEREIAREVPRLIEALRMRPGRRRSEARSGRPWLRKALRKSTATQGVPFVLPLQRPKAKRTRVVLLVDVSFSVARAAGFFLLLAGAFIELGRRARVVCFVDRPVEATGVLARWMRGRGTARPGPDRPGKGIVRRGIAFADVLDGIEGLNLQAPSDYGRALHGLAKARPTVSGRDTLLVVLGDARANRFDPLPWAFADLAARCGGVVWLVPEPASRWGTGDSALPLYLSSIDVLVEATDLAGIAAGVAELRRRL